MSTVRYAIDTTHSAIELSVRHLVIAKVRGRFTRFTGTIDLDPVDVTRSQVSARIDAASIDTAEPRRDDHLRSPDFLDTARFPELVFTSKAIERKGDGLRLIGDLTIRDVTKSVVLPVTHLGTAKDPWGNLKLAFEGETTINRKDFGLNWNAALETGGFLVGDEVKIGLQIQAA